MRFFFSVPPPEKRRGRPGGRVPRMEVAWFVSADGHRWLRGTLSSRPERGVWDGTGVGKTQPRKEKPGREAAPCPKAGAVIVTPRSPCVPIARLPWPKPRSRVPKMLLPSLGPSFGAGWGPPEVLSARCPAHEAFGDAVAGQLRVLPSLHSTPATFS